MRLLFFIFRNKYLVNKKEEKMFKGLFQAISRIFELYTYCANSQFHFFSNYVDGFSCIKIFFKNFLAF